MRNFLPYNYRPPPSALSQDRSEIRSDPGRRAKMADTGAQPDELRREQVGAKLKYLDFVQVAALQAATCFWSLYVFARENAGPLRPGVQTVEGTVKAVVGPVYEKFRDVPFELLKFVDHKIDEVVREVDRHVPSLLKRVSTQSYSAAQRAPEVAKSLAAEVQRSGLTATALEMAREAKVRFVPVVQHVWGRCEPVVERYAVATWRSLNQLPVFPQVAQIVVPTAAYWSDKYNRAVACAGDRGYVVAEFLPLVPTERISKVFAGEVNAPPPPTAQ
ncbi:Stress-related protein [Apostasia shenzhenica]|uniref:Stress-related protein n=1 Tax=Apostasia shenzhenica TaxID=1088818 RepID=A0A2I0A621_9ASPA|nr:Stress-related protein [Apostasia shenzhenica]